MSDGTFSYPSMSQPTPDAAANPSADSSNQTGMDYDMGDLDSAGFEKENFTQASWPSEARDAVKVASEFLSYIDPDKSLYGEMWAKDLGGGKHRGDSLIHVAAVARAAQQAQRRMNERLGIGPTEDGSPRLSYNMPMSQGQRRGLVNDFRDILNRELMQADAEFIRMSKRGITTG